MGIESSLILFSYYEDDTMKQRKTQEWGLKESCLLVLLSHKSLRKQRKTQEWGLKVEKRIDYRNQEA